MTNTYQAIKVQNQSLEKYISGIGDYYSLERNQFNRKTEKLPILGYIKNALVILYGVVYLVLLVVLFMKGRGLSIYVKIALILVFGMYPFFIYPFENALYQIYYYTYAVIYGESYTTIVSRKGIQNPKNFKDITNLGYTIQNPDNYKGLNSLGYEIQGTFSNTASDIYNTSSTMTNNIRIS